MFENLKKIQGGNDTFQGMPKIVAGGHLAMRIRLASKFDVVCLRALAENNKGSTARTSTAMQTALLAACADEIGVHQQDLRPAQLVTEINENVMTAQTSAKAFANMAPIAQENLRYLFSDDAGPRILVKPGADPARPQATAWLTKQRLLEECYEASTNWTQAGRQGGLGKVYLEVLECRGLPNMDSGTYDHYRKIFLIFEGNCSSSPSLQHQGERLLAKRQMHLYPLSTEISWCKPR